MKRLLPFVLPLALFPGAGLAPGLVSCNDGSGLLRAKVIDTRAELIGGPVAMADVGDYLLENDQIRIAILGPRDSPAPGVFGGSIIDVDRRRSRMGESAGQGHDRFAETFPLANLIVPDATRTDFRIVSDGSNGREARVRVEGDGEFLFEALAILRNKKDQLDILFPNVHTSLRFRTDYVVRPGDRHVVLETTLFITDPPPVGCAPLGPCDLDCNFGYQDDPSGCPVCACSERLPLETATAPIDVFGTALGDSPGSTDPPAKHEAGIVAGDFVFFGNQNDVFAPGPGFDEEIAVEDANNTGRNTFTQPLVFDFVAAAGGDVSYGYFTKGDPGGAPAVVNVPLFASAATAFLTGKKSCLMDASDDAACDAHRAFYYQRYLVVGDGDVASVTDEIHRVRGTTTGTLAGQVLWESGEPAPNAHVFLFADPDPSREFANATQVAEANRASRGDAGVMLAIDADLGLDRVEDGDFRASVPPGDYVLVARDDGESATSKPVHVHIEGDRETLAAPLLPSPAKIELRVTDEKGNLVPAKLTLITLDKNGVAAEGDGLRKPYLGEGRLGNGVRFVDVTPSGEQTFSVEPGRYKAVVSRGPEYGIWIDDAFEVPSGTAHAIDAVVPREIDTAGFVAADMHLHARTSFDSGMPLTERVTTAAAEGLEVAVATDHDVETDYLPSVRALGLEPLLKTIVGGEITTLEQGHFIGFPLEYDELVVPTHGAYDWTCNTGGEILAGIRSGGAPGKDVFTILAHPRDGFFGYVDQAGTDPYTGKRVPTLLESENPVFRTVTCDYDGMEVLNGKRFDLIRTPTVDEMVTWTRCRGDINQATTLAELNAACPGLAPWPPAPCTEADGLDVCRSLYRTKAAWATTRRMLERTPEEQAADWAWSGTRADTEELCDDESFGGAPPDPSTLSQPCAFRPGHVDDYFRNLERGLTRIQVASSDSHETAKEPGYPRTYVASATDSPMAVTDTALVESLRAGHAFASYGPFIRATVDEGTFGDVVAATPGKEKALLLEVQTASWFGVDRVEVYLNGTLIRVVTGDEPASALVDVRGKVTFTVPDRDSWLVVIAMGLADERLMRPVSLDVPFGEVQLSKLASDAFGRLPGLSALFSASPLVPDWSPLFPYAITNAIYLDTDKNGRYDAPLPRPEACSRPCDPNEPNQPQCPDGQTCLEQDRQCGFVIGGTCDHRRVAVGPDR